VKAPWMRTIVSFSVMFDRRGYVTILFT
jgi:hypothetical protein